MSDLIQKEDQYASYSGWYGVYGDSTESEDIENYPEIYFVFTTNKNGTKTYKKGRADFLQGFTKFESGTPYIIFLEKGSSKVIVSNFTQSGEDSMKLVLENQNGHIEDDLDETFELNELSNRSSLSCLGWYGIVNTNECNLQNYDLTKNSEIRSVIRYKDGEIDTYRYGRPLFLQSFTELEVGYCYYLTFSKNNSNIKIKNFISSNTILKIKQKQKFKCRQKTKVFVCLWNFVNMFGSLSTSFADKSYYLGEVDSRGNQIKSKLKVKDIENMLNQENYVYPQQDYFEQNITGSVSDYFKSVTQNQIDFKFEIVNLGNRKYTDDPDEYAYSVVDRNRINDSSQLRIDIINSFSKIRRKYKFDVFPKNFDDRYKKYDRDTAFGLIIHCADSKKIRSRNLKVDPDANGLLRRFSICNVVDRTNRSRLEPIGVHVHELIHSFDLKDLYSSGVSAMSKIDTMGYGFWGFTKRSSGKYFPFFPSSYTRLKMYEFYNGSIDVIEIRKSTKDIEISPAMQSRKIIKIKNPNLPDIWYVDYRTPIAHKSCINFDREMGDSGLSIVHEYPPIFDNRNPVPIHKRGESGLSVSLEQQDGLYHLQESDLSNIELDESQTADNKSDFFKEGDEFSPQTIPSTTSYIGQPSDIKVHNIRTTERNTILFDVEFLNQPNSRILNVKYYTNSISDGNLVPQTCGGRRNCRPTENSPFEFDFTKIPYQSKSIHIEITTKDIPNGIKISLFYLKKNAFAFTNPGGWATGVVNNNKVRLQIPRGLIGLYLQNEKNHFIYKVNEKGYENTYWYIDFIHVIS